MYIIANTLLDQLAVHHGSHLTDLLIDLPLLIGLSLLYLSTLLRRRKRTAWLVTVAAYTFYLGNSVTQVLGRASLHDLDNGVVLRIVIVPAIVLGLLILFEKEFVVKSDIQGFRQAARFSVIVLIIALLYGVAGFILMDQTDFHQEITAGSAFHYTVDQFDWTTNRPLQAYTKRAHLFTDSLSFISVAALTYALVALFQPLRVRFSDHAADREHMRQLLERYGAPSEEYFKLWPHDKQYFFDRTGESGLAFRVHRGVALCLSDPVGDATRFSDLLEDFQGLCFRNDWLPAHIHISETYRALYEKHGFSLQKLGEEAILDLDDFTENVSTKKYFRQINNRFNKQGYYTELLTPPHHDAVISRLKTISDSWLAQGARSERGFAMGYFRTEYMQRCSIYVARDAADTIQAFATLVPAPFDTDEATYDLLRHSDTALGNCNDYLLMALIAYLRTAGYKRLNLGLCPLAGLEDTSTERRTLLDNVLQFAYSNGDRFYSFSGLHRFKAKYHPMWQPRYVAYQDGVRGFSRTMTALTRTMHHAAKLEK